MRVLGGVERVHGLVQAHLVHHPGRDDYLLTIKAAGIPPQADDVSSQHCASGPVVIATTPPTELGVSFVPLQCAGRLLGFAPFTMRPSYELRHDLRTDDLLRTCREPGVHPVGAGSHRRRFHYRVRPEQSATGGVEQAVSDALACEQHRLRRGCWGRQGRGRRGGGRCRGWGWRGRGDGRSGRDRGSVSASAWVCSSASR